MKKYSHEDIVFVLKSLLDVYDRKKDIPAHESLMLQRFGADSSMVRNAKSYAKGFTRTLSEGNPNLGQSMSANWAKVHLELLQSREPEFSNVLDACKKIYDQKGTKTMLKVIQDFMPKDDKDYLKYS